MITTKLRIIAELCGYLNKTLGKFRQRCLCFLLYSHLRSTKNEHSGTPQTAMVNLKFSESAIKEIKSDKTAEILTCRESQMITFQKHILYYLTLCTAYDPQDAEQAIQEFNYVN